MRKCCGKAPILKTYDIAARAATTDTPARKAQTAYWYECKNCGTRNSYSYNSAKEAEEAWDAVLVGRPQA